MHIGARQQASAGDFAKLYALLLEASAWLSSRWGMSENNRKAKFYRLTAAGRRQLDVETGQWKRIAVAISYALEAT